MTKATLWIFVL